MYRYEVTCSRSEGRRAFFHALSNEQKLKISTSLPRGKEGGLNVVI